MDDPFRGISAAKDEAAEDKYQLRSLTDNFVFCPKCGMENFFNLSKEGKKLIYFCIKCQSILNNYWDGYIKGRYDVAKCSTCQQPSFRDFKYCISCGSINDRVIAMPFEGLLGMPPKVVSESEKSRIKGLLLFSCVLCLMVTGVLLIIIGLYCSFWDGSASGKEYAFFGIGIALLVIPPVTILILQIIKNAKKKRESSIED